MIWFLLVFAALTALARLLYVIRRRAQLRRERMALLRHMMEQQLQALRDANREADDALEFLQLGRA